VGPCAVPVHTFHIGSGRCVTLWDTAPVPPRHWLRYLCDTRGWTTGSSLCATCQRNANARHATALRRAPTRSPAP